LLLLPLHAGPPPASCTPSLHDALPILLPRLHDHDSLDVAYSLALTRCHHDRRAVAVVGDGELAALEELANGRGTITTTAKPKLRSEEHTSELQSREKLVCRLLLEKKNK